MARIAGIGVIGGTLNPVFKALIGFSEMLIF